MSSFYFSCLVGWLYYVFVHILMLFMLSLLYIILLNNIQIYNSMKRKADCPICNVEVKLPGSSGYEKAIYTK